MRPRPSAGGSAIWIWLLTLLAAATLAPVPLIAVPPSSGPKDDPGAVCTHWAATDGSDLAEGSASRPVRTSARLVALLREGETACLRSGRYRGDVVLARDGTTLRSAPGERATLDLAGTLEIADGAEDVTVSDLDIVGGRRALTVRTIGDRFRLERNDITNRYAGRSCVLVGGAVIETRGGVIRDNVIHHCGHPGSNLDHGIYAQYFGRDRADRPGLLVESNTLFEVAGYAVQLYPRGIGAVVRRNVIDGGGKSIRGGIVVDGTVARDNVLENNLIIGTRTGAIVVRSGTGHVARGNCFWDNPSDVSGSQVVTTGSTTNADRVHRRCPLDLVLR